ncbi:hypothetical protein PVL30_004828 [Lodderomyces elongisporus]|uniref:uncharacterized protein n=1 Tax=Lodderomyces elongisporus TaxID=36914 RepID=UPI0029226A4A|nr:uncharacterized protein PVL30_004828 [Lodderomyces elongisporus]WLF81034.1 hypothetical protein PVL30_004828 [Lodderomyces elongisporus]
MQNFSEKLGRLLEWINLSTDEQKLPSQCYISPKITVKDVKGSGRGIYATASISPHEKIINIGHPFLLNFTTVLNHIAKHNKMEIDRHVTVPFETKEDEFTEIYKCFKKEELLRLSSFQLLSMYLTLERKRGENSYWKAFIDMLPTMEDFQLMPITYGGGGGGGCGGSNSTSENGAVHENENGNNFNADDNQIQLKQQLPATAYALNEKVEQRFNHDYKVITQLLLAKNISDVSTILPRDDVLLSWLCINSRCLYMDLPTSHDTSDNFTMAPYIDFINHSCDDHCTLKIDAKGFQITTTTAYKPGDQLYLSYGPHSNEFLLCEYGFVVTSPEEENRWNDLDISSYLLPMFNANQIDCLKENDFYDNYTLNKDGPSFRTEVALAILQEQNPHDSRRFRAFLNGILDNTVYLRKSNTMLSKILTKIMQEAEQHQFVLENVKIGADEVQRLRLHVVMSLYKDRLALASRILKDLK